MSATNGIAPRTLDESGRPAMTLRFRMVCTGVALTAIIGLVGLSDDAEACPRRCRLFSGGLFAGRKCAPLVSEPIAPDKSPPVAVEPPKEPPLPAVSKDMAVNVKNIAALLKKGDILAAKKLARAAAKESDEVTDIMQFYRPRSKGG